MKLAKGNLGWVMVTVLAVFSTLTWLFWDFIRDGIVVPIYYLIWLVGLILNSIPQGLFLLLLIFVCFLIALNTLIKFQPRQSNQSASYYRSMKGSRYHFWNRLLANLRTNPFSRDDFAFEARILILSILAYQEGVDIPGIEQMLADHKISAPLSVTQLILSKKLQFLPEKGHPHGRKLPKFLHRFFQKDARDESMIDEQAQEIIHFIEDRLELNHDEQ